MPRNRRFPSLWLLAIALSLAPPRSSRADAKTAPGGSLAVRYLALGDSFTIGTGGPPERSFPARLAARWQAAGAEVELSIPARNGYTTDDVLALELPEVAGFRPSLATLAVGANDLVRGRDAESYRAQLRRIFAALAQAGVGGGRVVTLPQPDWSRSPAARDFGEPDEIRQRIVTFNAVLREESLRIGARFVDLWPLMQREAEAKQVAGDGLHPSGPAYDEWSAELARALDPRRYAAPGK